MDTDPPFWLTTPCPAWCVKQHADDDRLDERRHESDILARVLLLSMMDKYTADPVETEVQLIQGYREIGPLIHIRSGRKHELVCVLDEAEQIAGALLDGVRAGGSTR